MAGRCGRARRWDGAPLHHPPATLAGGYALGLTLGAALLVAAVVVALTVLPGTGSPSTEDGDTG